MTSPAFNSIRRLRWWQFRLSTFLLVCTVLAAWLGIHVERGRRQQEVVAALTRLEVGVHYRNEHEWLTSDSYLQATTWIRAPQSATPAWIQETLGIDLVESLTAVTVGSDANVDAIAPHLKRLPALEEVFVPGSTCGNALPSISETKRKLEQKLPGIRISILPSPPIVG